MINIEQFDEKTEPQLLNTVLVFNQLYRIYPESIAEMTYHKLYTLAEPEHQISLALWKSFYTDKRVQRWYEQELALLMQSKLHVLTRQAGSDRSTATQQALQGLLKHISENNNKSEENKIFVYTHIPLTRTEEHLENVRIETTIPEEIRSALTILNESEED